MKRIVFLTLAGCSLLTACGNKESEQAVTQDTVQQVERPKAPIHLEPRPTPNGETFAVEYSDRALDSVLLLPASERPATAEAAAEYHLSMPPKLTVPPHFIPVEEIKLTEKTDTTATFTFVGAHNPIKGILLLRKVRRGADSAWIVQMVTGEHPRQ